MGEKRSGFEGEVFILGVYGGLSIVDVLNIQYGRGKRKRGGGKW